MILEWVPKSLLLFVFPLLFSPAMPLRAQTPTAAEVLQRSIEYHDPQGLWGRFKGSLTVVAEYPERPCFLLGAEVGGVPADLLDEARLVVRIPQWGLVPSLNLAVAGSIVTSCTSLVVVLMVLFV